jgi:hypothetical protein
MPHKSVQGELARVCANMTVNGSRELVIRARLLGPNNMMNADIYPRACVDSITSLLASHFQAWIVREQSHKAF